MVFKTATVSSAGGRASNQDACGHAIHGSAGCWVLCDGLGGHRAGEVASRTAVDDALASFAAGPSVAASAHPQTRLAAIKSQLQTRAAREFDNYSAIAVRCAK